MQRHSYLIAGLIIALGLLILISFAGCSMSGPSHSMLKMMSDLAEAKESMDRIWPGYHPSTRHFAVYREGEDILLLSNSPVSSGIDNKGFTRLAEELWYSPTQPSALAGAFTTAADLGGVTATAISADLDLALLIHEDFHAFQSDAWDLGPPPRLDSFNNNDVYQLAFEFELETYSLLKAWGANRRAQRTHLLDYLALRSVREAAMAEADVKSERHFELIEGTATYVDMQATSLAGVSIRRRSRLLKQALASTEIEPAQFMVRNRSYAVGYILCNMLDFWASESSWKHRVSSGGETLPDLLVETLKIEEGELQARGRRLRSEKQFQRRLAKKRLKGSTLQPAVDLTRYKWQLSFALPVGPEDPNLENAGSVSFDGGGILHLSADWTLVPSPKSYYLRLSGAKLNVNGHPVLSRKVETAGHQVVELVILMKQPPKLKDGALQPGVHMLSGRPFHESGVSLNFIGSVRVELSLLSDSDPSDHPWVGLVL